MTDPAGQPSTPKSSTADGAWPMPLVAIVGPTASGKSAVAIALAELLGAEIVNADAFQVYRGMDIGTAKPSPDEQARVRHHLIDVLDIQDELSVAWYQERGRTVLHDLAARGVPAVVVGGSGLYLRGLLDDLRFPGSDPSVRAHWERRLTEVGPERLHAELARSDPMAAAEILPSNGRRIVRALEVGQITGSGFVARLPVDGPALVPHRSFGLAVNREQLDARIAARTERMFHEGFVEEVRGLLDRGLRDSPTAGRALGYPQIVDVIEGRCDPEQAKAAIVAATRTFARRQQRWFRRDPRTEWLPSPADPISTASLIVARLSEPPRTLDA